MRGYSQMNNARLSILTLGAALAANADFSYTSTQKPQTEDLFRD